MTLEKPPLSDRTLASLTPPQEAFLSVIKTINIQDPSVVFKNFSDISQATRDEVWTLITYACVDPDILLLWAIYTHQPSQEIQRIYLELEAKINNRGDGYNLSLLKIACLLNDLNVIRVLLSFGALINEGQSESKTPSPGNNSVLSELNLACQVGHVDVVMLLILECRAPVTLTSFYFAFNNNHVGIAKFLLVRNIVNSLTSKHYKFWGYGPEIVSVCEGEPDLLLAYALLAKQSIEEIDRVILLGANISGNEKYKWTPLEIANKCKHAEAREYFIRNGAREVVELSATPWGDLNRNILGLIFSFLPRKYVLRSGCMSVRWNQVAYEYKDFHEKRFACYFPQNYREMIGDDEPEGGWGEEFVCTMQKLTKNLCEARKELLRAFGEKDITRLKAVIQKIKSGQMKFELNYLNSMLEGSESAGLSSEPNILQCAALSGFQAGCDEVYTCLILPACEKNPDVLLMWAIRAHQPREELQRIQMLGARISDVDEDDESSDDNKSDDDEEALDTVLTEYIVKGQGNDKKCVEEQLENYKSSKEAEPESVAVKWVTLLLNMVREPSDENWSALKKFRKEASDVSEGIMHKLYLFARPSFAPPVSSERLVRRPGF